jgi:2-polyprenyl-3-methyl-5-hydroxy-6-metoxy-1,4-benzoquinol methylase
MTIPTTGTIAFYNEHATEYSDSTISVDMQDIRDRFQALLPKHAYVLDAGCGSGRDTKALLQAGLNVTAIDASTDLARLASAYTGIACQVLRFQDMTFNACFDGIWACASLLHVPKIEMPDVMARMSRALKGNGILYLSLKQGNAERVAEDGRFFNYYTIPSFRMLLAVVPELVERDSWITAERRSTTQRDPWVSFLLQKV